MQFAFAIQSCVELIVLCGMVCVFDVCCFWFAFVTPHWVVIRSLCSCFVFCDVCCSLWCRFVKVVACPIIFGAVCIGFRISYLNMIVACASKHVYGNLSFLNICFNF